MSAIKQVTKYETPDGLLFDSEDKAILLLQRANARELSESFIRSAFHVYTEEVSEYLEPQELWQKFIDYLINTTKTIPLTQSVYYYVTCYLEGNFIDRLDEYPDLSDTQWEILCKDSCLFFNEEFAFHSFNGEVK